MIPERLVTIRRYQSAEAAAPDEEILDQAGVTVYRDSGRRRQWVELRAPASQLAQAATALGLDVSDLAGAAPAETAHDAPDLCPHCGAPRASTTPLATYPVLGAAAAGLVLGIAVDQLVGWGVFILVSGPIIVLKALRRRAARCKICGRRV